MAATTLAKSNCGNPATCTRWVRWASALGIAMLFALVCSTDVRASEENLRKLFRFHENAHPQRALKTAQLELKHQLLGTVHVPSLPLEHQSHLTFAQSEQRAWVTALAAYSVIEHKRPEHWRSIERIYGFVRDKWATFGKNAAPLDFVTATVGRRRILQRAQKALAQHPHSGLFELILAHNIDTATAKNELQFAGRTIEDHIVSHIQQRHKEIKEELALRTKVAFPRDDPSTALNIAACAIETNYTLKQLAQAGQIEITDAATRKKLQAAANAGFDDLAVYLFSDVNSLPLQIKPKRLSIKNSRTHDMMVEHASGTLAKHATEAAFVQGGLYYDAVAGWYAADPGTYETINDAYIVKLPSSLPHWYVDRLVDLLYPIEVKTSTKHEKIVHAFRCVLESTSAREKQQRLQAVDDLLLLHDAKAQDTAFSGMVFDQFWSNQLLRLRTKEQFIKIVTKQLGNVATRKPNKQHEAMATQLVDSWISSQLLKPGGENTDYLFVHNTSGANSWHRIGLEIGVQIQNALGAQHVPDSKAFDVGLGTLKQLLVSKLPPRPNSSF